MSNVKQWRSLTLSVRKTLDELPSPDEREETVRALNELVAFLGDLSNVFGAMPTTEEASKAKEALVNLESIVNRNPALRGGSNGKSAKPRVRNGSKPTQAASSFSEEVIEQTIAGLSALPEGAMRSELEDSKRFPNSFIKAILTHLGRRAPSKGVKGEMIDQLVATLINRRTLDGISGRRRL